MKQGLVIGLYLYQMRCVHRMHLYESVRVINHVLIRNMQYPVHVLKRCWNRAMERYQLRPWVFSNKGLVIEEILRSKVRQVGHTASTVVMEDVLDDNHDDVVEECEDEEDDADEIKKFVHIRYWPYSKKDLVRFRDKADPKSVSYHLGKRRNIKTWISRMNKSNH